MILFALAAILLFLAVLAAISFPVLFGAEALPERGQFDRAVYRDQLLEVDRDIARGVLSAVEADAARLEIQRRLLAVDSIKTRTATGSGRSPRLAAAASLFVVVGACGVYWHLGAPTLSDAPFSERPAVKADAAPPGEDAAAPHQDMKEAAKRLEEKLQTDPSNGERWVLFARTESMLGDWRKAENAYRRAIDLGQKGTEVYAGWGEMLVLAENGIVSPTARGAFESALMTDPRNDVARYYLALADGQAGEVSKAISAWLALAADIPDNSPMRDEIARRVTEAARSGGIAAPPLPKGTAAQPGPTPDQMAATAGMSDAERDQMIGGMVEKLAARLRDQPNDVDGWLRLGLAYAVRGETAKAVDAYENAARLKPDDPGIKLQAVVALLSRLKPDDTLPPKAVELLRQVATVAPEAPEVLWYLGVVAAREGRAAEARRNWTLLLAKLPEGSEDQTLVRAALGRLP